jgi:hypothetical protein
MHIDYNHNTKNYTHVLACQYTKNILDVVYHFHLHIGVLSKHNSILSYFHGPSYFYAL